MKNIEVKIESPVKYYDFVDQHGDVLATLKLVPSDFDIFGRHKQVVNTFEKMQNELKNVSGGNELDEESAKALKEKFAQELKEQFNYLFNTDTSGFFSIASPFTPLEDGTPWAVVILKNTMKIIEEATGKNFKAMESQAGKYVDKYHAGPGKYPFPIK